MADDDSPRPFRRERNLSNRNYARRGSNRRRFMADTLKLMETKQHLTLANNNNNTNNSDSDNNNRSSISRDAAEEEELTSTSCCSLSAATTTTTSPYAGSTSSNSSSNSSASASASENSSSSSVLIPYSVGAETESGFDRKSPLKMKTVNIEIDEVGPEVKIRIDVDEENDDGVASLPSLPSLQTDLGDLEPDPALLDVKQKVLRFETLQADERILFKTGRYKSKSAQSLSATDNEPPPNGPTSPTNLSAAFLAGAQRVLPSTKTDIGCAFVSPRPSTTGFRASIDEERSEDEVEGISDYAASPLPNGTSVLEFRINDFGRVESIRRTLSADANNGLVAAINSSVSVPSRLKHSISGSGSGKKEGKVRSQEEPQPTGTKDFPRNYRSTPRPKTEIIGSTDYHYAASKYSSLRQSRKGEEDEGKDVEVDEEEAEGIELRNKSFKCVQPILEELIKTEESYVENLLAGIENYGNVFQRKDLPLGLRGKKYVLLGNVEQLAEFHRDEFLPMLRRNSNDLKRIFDEFQLFIDQNCFYGYVIFTMNKQRSLKLCDVYKNYFKMIQTELDDKLGINSFLVQPIQRMARYPLLLQQFITTMFKNRDYVMKPLIESCCRLEKKLRNLLITTNESEIINDIVYCNESNEFNAFYQGKFRKVSEFQVVDHTLKRTYRSKVFMFDKCIVYTEIKGKQLIFHGRYPCEHIGIVAKTKSFTLYYEQRKQQECDFNGDPLLIETWLDLIRDMISSFAEEERRKLREMHSSDQGDQVHRKPPNLSLFRDSNRFSSDSGIGNIWVMPKPEPEELQPSNRTTWYAVT